MDYFLGIFGGVGTNPSAALLKGKKIIAFAEEERFNRIKNAPLALPINAIFYCLKTAKISINKIKTISFGWDCPHQFYVVPTKMKKMYKKYGSLGNDYNLNLEKRIKLGYDPDKIYNELKWAFAKRGQKFHKKITFYNEAAEQMFGYTRSEAVGREVKTIIPSMHGFFQDSFSENGNGIVANKPIRVVHELEMTSDNST